MRKPTAPEQLYIDFDGFFAACEEEADRRRCQNGSPCHALSLDGVEIIRNLGPVESEISEEWLVAVLRKLAGSGRLVQRRSSCEPGLSE